MSGAWDDWEQADEAEIDAPVVLQRPVKTTTTPVTPMILQRNNSASNHDRMGPTLLRREDDTRDHERSLHEKNRALWDKANAYELPVICRDDSHQRTEYVPEIKILRRPKSPVTTVKTGRTQPKSLAQREADYNAAREKIFGPSPSASTSPSRSPTPTGTQPSSSTSSTTNSRSTPASHPGPASAAASGSGSSTGLKPKSSRSSPTLARPPTSVRQGRKDTSSPDSAGGPSTDRKAHGSSTKALDTAIRQPQGPTMVASSSSSSVSSRGGRRGGGSEGGGEGGSGSRMSRQPEGGSIGFRKGPFRGVSRPVPQSDPTL